MPNPNIKHHGLLMNSAFRPPRPAFAILATGVFAFKNASLAHGDRPSSMAHAFCDRSISLALP